MQACGFAPTQVEIPNSKEFFRYSPKGDQLIILVLATLQYRRLGLVGNDKEKKKTENETLKVLKSKMPTMSRVVEFLHKLYFHSIVNLAVFLFLGLLTVIQHNFFNLISQFFILVMLATYLNKGLKTMLNYWPIIVIYQALVLLILVFFNFLENSALTAGNPPESPNPSKGLNFMNEFNTYYD